MASESFVSEFMLKYKDAASGISVKHRNPTIHGLTKR